MKITIISCHENDLVIIIIIIKRSHKFNDLPINGEIGIIKTLNTYIETVVNWLKIYKNGSTISDKVNFRDPL